MTLVTAPVREASVRWVQRALAARAEDLVRMAEKHDVPIEALVRWIQVDLPVAEFESYCEAFEYSHWVEGHD